jgi:hypothetical protein
MIKTSKLYVRKSHKYASEEDIGICYNNYHSLSHFRRKGDFDMKFPLLALFIGWLAGELCIISSFFIVN